MDRFTRRILDHLSDQRYRPRQLAELAADLSIDAPERDEFRRSVEHLIENGQVVLSTSNAVVLPPPGREMTGGFRLNERGFGFIVPDSPTEHGDLFVPQGNTNGAMTGDRVRARVIHAGNRGAGKSPYLGQVVDIIQRAEKRYVGNLAKRGSGYVVEIDGRVFSQPVIVRDPHSHNAKIGDKVVVELLEYPTETAPAEGVITQVLGEQGEPEVETLAVMHAYGLHEAFPPQVLQDARAAAQGFHDGIVPPERENFTQEFVCTIDPPDAKDFDDAISIRRLDGGDEPSRRGHAFERNAETGPAAWELAIHIADVSHFVKLDSALDTEARQRGNSAYLPRKVVPMLPELLSNGVCSLQEGVHRFCKSAIVRYDRLGQVVGARFANTVIRSAKRLTYLEAQALIDGDIREARRHARTEPKYSSQLIDTLKLMNELAHVIQQRRDREGMIVLGLPEVELVFDDSGRVVDAKPTDDAYTHKLIEMFMVEANEAVARLFDSLRVPMIRRIHPDPDAHDITELRQFARVAGYNIPNRPSRKELQQLLNAVRGKPAQHAVHLAVLKTLSKAEYSPLPIGHFALASRHYTHFTSPIRRYPDLVVHRGLDAYFEASRSAASRSAERSRQKSRQVSEAKIGDLMRNDPRCPDEKALTELGRHCSATERNAEAAEDALRTYLVLDLLSQQLGEDYQGTVSGVTAGGVFVQIDHYLVEGFVKLDDLPGLPDDRWRMNRNTGALVAQRSGKSITIGDRFVVRIARVNPQSRQMDLVVISDPARKTKTQPAGKPRRTQPPGAKKSHQQAQRFKMRKKRGRHHGRR